MFRLNSRFIARPFALGDGVMPYGKRRKSGRANVRAVRSQIKRLEHRLIGRFVKGPVDPPSVVSCPWNSVVISTTLLGDKAGWASIKTGQLRTTLRKQVGLSTEQKIDLRLKRISAWNPWMSDYLDVSGTRWDQFLAMQIYDPFQGTTTATAEDAGTNVRPPHLTYLYPVEIFRKVIGTDQDVVFCQFDVQRNINLILHVEVLWRCPEYDPLPSSESTLQMTGNPKGNPIRLTTAQATLLSPIVACQRSRRTEQNLPPPPPPQDTPPPVEPYDEESELDAHFRYQLEQDCMKFVKTRLQRLLYHGARKLAIETDLSKNGVVVIETDELLKSFEDSDQEES